MKVLLTFTLFVASIAAIPMPLDDTLSPDDTYSGDDTADRPKRQTYYQQQTYQTRTSNPYPTYDAPRRGEGQITHEGRPATHDHGHDYGHNHGYEHGHEHQHGYERGHEYSDRGHGYGHEHENDHGHRIPYTDTARHGGYNTDDGIGGIIDGGIKTVTKTVRINTERHY